MRRPGRREWRGHAEQIAPFLFPAIGMITAEIELGDRAGLPREYVLRGVDTAIARLGRKDGKPPDVIAVERQAHRLLFGFVVKHWDTCGRLAGEVFEKLRQVGVKV